MHRIFCWERLVTAEEALGFAPPFYIPIESTQDLWPNRLQHGFPRLVFSSCRSHPDRIAGGLIRHHWAEALEGHHYWS